MRRNTTDTSAADAEMLRRRIVQTLPVEDRRLDLAGVSTAVLEGGQGPPLVLLHGQGEFAATWGRAIPDLARDHHVIAPDLPGHGASEVVTGRLDEDQVLRWLGELLDATTSGPVTVAGHLLGGAIAARFTIRQAERVERLVLVDAFGLSAFRPSLRFALAMFGFVAHPTERTQERLFQRCFLDLDGLREEMGPSMELLEAYALDRAKRSSVKASIRRLMTTVGLPTIPEDDLQRIRRPVSLIWGRHDLQARLAVAEAANARYGWPLRVIEDAADDPAVEQPEAFVTAMRELLGRPAPRITTTAAAEQGVEA